MFRTIAVALLAAGVFAAPALAETKAAPTAAPAASTPVTTVKADKTVVKHRVHRLTRHYAHGKHYPHGKYVHHAKSAKTHHASAHTKVSAKPAAKHASVKHVSAKSAPRANVN